MHPLIFCHLSSLAPQIPISRRKMEDACAFVDLFRVEHGCVSDTRLFKRRNCLHSVALYFGYKKKKLRKIIDFDYG